MKINFLDVLFMSRLAKADRLNILVMIAIWFFMVILVNPLGDFPLNDDWVYGLSVKFLLEKGDFQLPASSSANVFAQVFWGALFCLPFGFSFTALRFSTLTLGLIGVIATYGILRQVKASPKLSLIGALLVAINPIYFELSNTFMTDIPFFTFFVLSFYFLIRGFQRDSNFEIIIGITASYIALLIRQLGLIIPLAFGVAYLVKKGINLQNIIKAFIPMVLGVSIQVFYSKWLYLTGRTTPWQIPQYSSFIDSISGNLVHVISHMSRIALVALIFLGLFIFPFIIIFLRKFSYSRPKKLTLFSLSTFLLIVMAAFTWTRKKFPIGLSDFAYVLGPGPLMLRDTFLLNLNYPPAPLALQIFWVVMAVIGIVGGALLFYYLWLAIFPKFGQDKASDFSETKWLNALIISAMFVYISLIGTGLLFDRYLLPLLPLSMTAVLLAKTTYITKEKLGFGITSFSLMLMLIFGGFSVGTTSDYLEWNRTRWQALRDLMQKDKVSSNQIDGGYEFNGWYLFDFKYKERPGRSYWWVNNDDYMISSGPLTGYEEVKRYPLRRWFRFQQPNIIVLHKTAESNSAKP
jgi:hypothetical protein